MDEAQTRAQLATMEVVGKLMIYLGGAGILDKELLARIAKQAAVRLDPVEDGVFLDTLQEQWLTLEQMLLQ